MEQYKEIVIVVSGSDPLRVEYQTVLWEWLCNNYNYGEAQVLDIGNALVDSSVIQYIYRK